MSKIPKRIHLVYKSKDLPLYSSIYYNRLKELHSDWEIIVHDDEEAQYIVKKNFSGMENVYKKYAKDIQRVDIFRVMCVYLYGGFYMDLDMFLYRKLDELCSNELVLAVERNILRKEMLKRNKRFSQRIANYMFGSVKKHPFWLDFIRTAIHQSKILIYKEEDILESTGPGLMTKAYHENKNKYKNIEILHSNKICAKWCKTRSCHFGEYAAHFHAGTWRWDTKSR